MAFWNRKKKRTTVKPKINASAPKPKVNSEKQESSIPPQPKKTDIPKPDKLLKNENIRKDRRADCYDVFGIRAESKRGRAWYSGISG